MQGGEWDGNVNDKYFGHMCRDNYFDKMSNYDKDYYNNPSNEGEIYLQIMNLSPFNVLIKKGEAIGQGIIKPYLITEDDNASGERIGGFGSTSK